MTRADEQRVLAIDCQVFQTPAWHRGMGKYSFNLLEAVFNEQQTSFNKVVMIFNKNLSIEKDCEQRLNQIKKDAELVFLDLAVVKNKKIVEFQDYNKQILNQYFDQNFPKSIRVDFIILSLFLGEATCIVFPTNAHKTLLFYDLIPFLYADRYKKRIPYDDYLANFKSVFEADLLLSISQTVADDLSLYLGIPEKKIVNINGAAINRENIPSARPDFNFDDKFILMPSGDEIRKNNLRAVKGFEKFNQAHGNKYQLILTSFFNEHTIKDLKSYSDKLIFTGNIKEEELQWLYENAALILFASEYEGLGLPVLEAMTVRKKIACSDIPVFKEISKDAFYYFDHLKPSAIARGIERALKDHSFSDKSKLYGPILSKYTWQNSAKTFMSALTAPNARQPKVLESKKPRIAVFTPHTAGYSAIGKVVAESHSALSELFDVDYYYDYGLFHREVRPDYLSSVANCYLATEFNARRYGDYAAVIYHIGNSDYHLETIKNALYLPGYVVLHDTFLDGAYERLAIDGYMSKKRIQAEKLLNKMLKTQKSRYLASLVNVQLGVFCHSEYAVKAVRQVVGEKVVVSKLNLPVAVPLITRDKGEHGRLNLCFAGIFADVKGLEVVERLATTLGEDGAKISIFGFDFAQPDSIKRLQELPNVEVIANPSDFEFQTLLSKQDILVNYRLTYRGETSLTTLEAMRFGVVPIVRNIGWYSELPEDSVVRLNTKEAVLDKILELHHNRDELKRLSHKAATIVADQFSHTLYAQKILALTTNPHGSANLDITEALKSGMPVPKLLKMVHKLG